MRKGGSRRKKPHPLVCKRQRRKDEMERGHEGETDAREGRAKDTVRGGRRGGKTER